MKRHRRALSDYVQETTLKSLHNCIIPNIWHSGRGKIIKTVKGSVVSRDWEKG